MALVDIHDFFIPICIWHPIRRGVSLYECCHNVWFWKIRVVGLSDGEKFENLFTRFDRTWQTDTAPHHRSRYG